MTHGPPPRRPPTPRPAAAAARSRPVGAAARSRPARGRAARRRRRATVLALGFALLLTGAVFGVVAMLGALDARGPVIERCDAFLTKSVRYSLAPDQADNAALMAGIATQRRLPARAATIALATAFQESKLRNIEYGDRDSLGLFQQRPSQGWGTQDQILDPVYATQAFYDVLVTIEGYETLTVTDAAQRVQRSAFPNAYADHEQLARAFASSLTGYSRGSLTCLLRPADETERAGARDAVVARLERDFGGVASSPADDGSLVIQASDLAPGASEQEVVRVAWGVAQWAVATADRTGVTQVITDGQVWRRSGEQEATWTPVGDDIVAPEPGQVLVR